MYTHQESQFVTMENNNNFGKQPILILFTLLKSCTCCFLVSTSADWATSEEELIIHNRTTVLQ